MIQTVTSLAFLRDVMSLEINCLLQTLKMKLKNYIYICNILLYFYMNI